MKAFGKRVAIGDFNFWLSLSLS